MNNFEHFGIPIEKTISYTLELLTPYEKSLGTIPMVLNYSYKNKLIGLNEIDFDIPAYMIVEDKEIAHPFFHLIENGMIVRVTIVGQTEPKQYIVDTANKSTEKSSEALMHIHAFSKEYFLSRKKFLGMELAGRILYYTPDLPDEYATDAEGLARGVLNDIFTKYGITVSHIDETLKKKAREVSIGSGNIYQLISHLEEVFSCIFKFNGNATEVAIYDSSTFGRKTNITISERNIINSFSEDSRYEDMVTRMYVYGSDDVSITSVNPTGLPYIEDLTYFLKEKFLPTYLIDLYKEFIELPKNTSLLQTGIQERNALFQQITEAEFYLEVVRDELRQATHWAEALQLREKNDSIAIGSDPQYSDETAWNSLKKSTDVLAFIDAVRKNTTITDRTFTANNISFVSLLELSRSADDELTNLFKDNLETLQARGGEAGWLAEITRLNNALRAKESEIKNLQQNNDFDNYMKQKLTTEQLVESRKAIEAITIEGEYINSDLDSSMLNELLIEGEKALAKACFPKIQFQVEALDFSQLLDTEDLWNYLTLGDTVFIKSDTGFNYPVYFIGIEHSPESASLNLQFSSAAAMTDSAIFLADLIASATRANGILTLNKENWNEAAEGTTLIKAQLQEGFDLAKQQLDGAAKQQPILDERGFWLYALDANGNPKPEQIRAVNNVIALTEDGWETVSVAITPEGINADTIVVGTLSADRVRLGRFESADKSTFWDLETNEIKIGDNFHFSPSTGLKINFKEEPKHKNLISTAGFFIEQSVILPYGAIHKFETNPSTGELSLITPKESGTYIFYIASDSAMLTQDFTLLVNDLATYADRTPVIKYALASTQFDLYSEAVPHIEAQKTYILKPNITTIINPLGFLQVSITKDTTTSETIVKIPAESLALVKNNIADLTWEDTEISGISSSAVITNERIGLTIQNNIENKLAALNITEEGITQRVSSSTKEYFDLNKELFKGDTGPKGQDGGNFTWNMIKGSHIISYATKDAEATDVTYKNEVDGSITYTIGTTPMQYSTYSINEQYLVTLDETFIRGDDFVFSLEMKLSALADVQHYTNMNIGGLYQQFNELEKAVGKWHRVWFTSKSSGTNVLKAHIKVLTTNVVMQIRNPMLHLGTTPAPYAPHITEIQGQDGQDGADGQQPFYAYADIDSIVTAIDRPNEVNYEPLNTAYYFDEDITSLIDEHGLDGWKISYDVKANAETIEELTVLTKPFSKYDSYQVHHPTTLNYEHYEQLITFVHVSLGKTTTLGVSLYNTPFSLKNFMLKKVGNISNFSTSWTNQKYQGIYVGYERPTDPNAYEWVKIQGDDGTSGSDGVGLEGEPTIQYGKSDDENTLPVEWFDIPILVEGGLISWTRTVLTYTDGTVTNIDTPFKVPLDGEQGQDGRGIVELQTMYGLSDSKDVEPIEWFAIPPEIKGGDFSWTRIELIFNDGTTEFVKTVTQNADILEVREDGYLYVNGVKTEKKVQGDDGHTPYVQDGYWYINGVNTGQKAVGKDASILYRFSNDKSTMSLVDNDHRYVGLYRGTGDVNLASSYVWLDRLDLKVLEDRIKTNESSIAVNKTNIENKVSQTTYTADQTKINDQLSTITQDMESWEAKFESVGGTNLLKGSKYVRGWLPINLETIRETYANVVQEWDTIDATKVVTNAPDSVSTKKAYKRFEVPTLEEGRLYTFTMYVNNIRSYDEKITLEGGLVGEATIIAGAKTRIIIQGYATSEKYIDVVLNSYGRGYYASAIVYKAMLEIGNQVNDWTPHPDEIESGSTRITEEGLTVGKSNSDVQTSIMDNGLFIQDTISGEPIAEYTIDGGNTSVLTATDIYSDSIIRRQKNSVDVYVGSTMTGDGSGKDSSNRLDNINRAIDVGLAYAYHLTDYATINVYIKGTINEIVIITGVSGYGNINIIGESGSRLVGAIFINSCTAQVNVRDLNISLDAPNATNACVNFHNSTNGNVVGCTLVGQNAGRGLNVTKSKVTVENTQFFDLLTALVATDLGEIIAIDNRGGNITYPEGVTKGGRLILQGTRFLANRAPTPDAYLPLGGWELDNSKGTGGTRPTFAPPTFGTVTKTFYADLSTANSKGYEWLKAEARQGTWDRKVNIGIAKFGSKIKDWLAANGGYQGTVTAVVTAKRNSASGRGTVSFKITNPYTLTLPAVSRGGSSSATAGTSLTNSIIASSNLVLKTSTKSSSDYAGYTSVSIKISTMKKV